MARGRPGDEDEPRFLFGTRPPSIEKPRRVSCEMARAVLERPAVRANRERRPSPDGEPTTASPRTRQAHSRPPRARTLASCSLTPNRSPSVPRCLGVPLGLGSDSPVHDLILPGRAFLEASGNALREPALQFRQQRPWEALLLPQSICGERPSL